MSVTVELNLRSLIRSDDPLSDNAIAYLLKHQEEDRLVDYKESFAPDSVKAWLDLNIDILAFANTFGGYLVFGVKDKTFDFTGVNAKAFDILCDIKKVLEKINRFVQPKFASIRSKGRDIDGKKVVVIFVPQARQKTHVFVTNADFRFPSGKTETVIRQGTIYVRKSGGNQLITADDFEELLLRRFDQIKEKMLDGIARVVNAEADQEVLIVSQKAKSGAQKYTITDSPDAIPVKGMSFSVTPGTEIEKVAAWIAMNKGDPDDLPPPRPLMMIYAKRSHISFGREHREWLSFFSLVKGLPAFFYLQELGKGDVISILKRAFDSKHAKDKFYILAVSVFYGKTVYNALYEKVSNERKHIVIQKYPDNRLERVFNVGRYSERELMEDEATKIAEELIAAQNQAKLYQLRKIDCGLYAPF